MSNSPLSRLTRNAAAVAGAMAMLLLTGCGTSGPELKTVTIPKQLTAPGTTLKLGETARVPGLGADDTGARHVTDVALTVLETKELDPAALDKFQPEPEFKDAVPHAIVFQEQFAAPDSESSLAGGGDFIGQLDNGTPAFTMITAQSHMVCDLGKFEVSDSERITCAVALVPQGRTLTAAEWDPRFLRADIDVKDGQPYQAKPIKWQLTK